jgi:hypothetical protein
MKIQSLAWIAVFLLIVLVQPLGAAVDPPLPDDPVDGKSEAINAADPADTAMTDILDIKPPVVFGMDPAMVRMGIWAAAAVLLGLALLLIIRAWKRRKQDTVRAPVPERAPEQQAFESLDELARNFPEARVFHFRLSAILREYLLGRYGCHAPEMTTEELLPALTRLNLDRELELQAKAFFLSSDQVKFAHAPANRASLEADLEFARQFVQRTTPAPPMGEPDKSRGQKTNTPYVDLKRITDG